MRPALDEAYAGAPEDSGAREEEMLMMDPPLFHHVRKGGLHEEKGGQVRLDHLPHSADRAW